jgi:hypothetical protein
MTSPELAEAKVNPQAEGMKADTKIANSIHRDNYMHTAAICYHNLSRLVGHTGGYSCPAYKKTGQLMV